MDDNVVRSHARLGVWVETVFNAAVTLGIMVGIPCLVWASGAHWFFVALSVPTCFLVSGFVAERVLFKLTWAERIFGKPEPDAKKETLAGAASRHAGKTSIELRDLTSEIRLADRLLGVDPAQTSFTLTERPVGLANVDLLEVARKGMPKQDPQSFHIDERGVRITRREEEVFYGYSDIEAIDLDDEDASPERPRSIYCAFELTFTAGGKRYRLPECGNEGNAAAWFVTQQYNRLREQEYRGTLGEGGEIHIGEDVNTNRRPVCLSAKGFRSSHTAIPIEEIVQVTIQSTGTVDVVGERARYTLPLDYGKPDSYVFLRLIKESVLPEAVPAIEAGAINRRISRARIAWSLFFSLACFGIAGYFISRAVATRSWPETDGTVLSQRIEDLQWGDEDGLFTIGYEVIVSYQYEVDGVIHTNETFKYGDKYFHFEKNALQLAENYPEQQTVTVFYNPDAPNQSVLEQGLGYLGYVFLSLGAFAFIFVIYFRASYERSEALREKASVR